MACARSRASVKTLVRIDRVEGMMAAPPMPITARAPMSMPAEPANAAVAEPRPKMARPTWRAPRRPKRSASMPAVRSRLANTSTYVSTIHCCWLAEAPRSSTSVGRATLRTVLSIPMTSRLRQSTASVPQRRR
jgi:hypothetical protein